MRTQSWEVLCLTELRGDISALGVRELIYVEEFTLIVAGRVGFLLSMGARIAWQSAGEKFLFTSDRACGIVLGTEAGYTIGVASAYLPSGSGAANLDGACRSLRVLCEMLQKEVGEQYFIRGDWNAHIGRGTMNDDTHVG
eukprot:7466895-Pyramimonas_sp.AAC.1